MLAFLIVGLLLPGTELFTRKTATQADHPKGSRKLAFSWIALLVVAGALNIFFAIIVPLVDHLSYTAQAPPTYGTAADALFSGASWQQIMSLSPALGLWIVLQMDNMCAGMIGGGILASAVSLKGFRYAKRWAWYAMLTAVAVYFTPFFIGSIPFFQAGIYASSTVSSGAPPDPAFFLFTPTLALPALSLLLPLRHFRLSSFSTSTKSRHT